MLLSRVQEKFRPVQLVKVDLLPDDSLQEMWAERILPARRPQALTLLKEPAPVARSAQGPHRPFPPIPQEH